MNWIKARSLAIQGWGLIGAIACIAWVLLNDPIGRWFSAGATAGDLAARIEAHRSRLAATPALQPGEEVHALDIDAFALSAQRRVAERFQAAGLSMAEIEEIGRSEENGISKIALRVVLEGDLKAVADGLEGLAVEGLGLTVDRLSIAPKGGGSRRPDDALRLTIELSKMASVDPELLKPPPSAGDTSALLARSPFDRSRSPFARPTAPAAAAAPPPDPPVVVGVNRDRAGSWTALMRDGPGEARRYAVGDLVRAGRIVAISSTEVQIESESGTAITASTPFGAN
ncbi:MAG: GspMb/PilO family protein [Pseudomonadota bacterium]